MSAMSDNDFPANEAEIFSAVRVELRPDCVAVYCVEGGEVETALDGVTATATFKGEQKDVSPTLEKDNRTGVLTLRSGDQMGDFSFVLGEPPPPNAHAIRLPEHSSCLVWRAFVMPTAIGSWPWELVRWLTLHSIIERLRVIGRTVLVVHVSTPLLPTGAP